MSYGALFAGVYFLYVGLTQGSGNYADPVTNANLFGVAGIILLALAYRS